MKFLIINTDYPEFIANDYRENPKLHLQPFAVQLQHRYDTFFGTADFYSRNLKLLGHEALDLIVNHPHIQLQWAREHGLKTDNVRRFLQKIPKIGSRIPSRWIESILKQQILDYRPDIIYNLAMETIQSPFLNAVKKILPVMVIGQHAAPITPGMEDLSAYDLLISSMPHYVDRFRAQGKPAEYLALGFEPLLLSKITGDKPVYPIIYIGGYGSIHDERTKLLEKAGKVLPISFWGYGQQRLTKDSIIAKNFKGFIGGIGMYRMLAQAKICLNKHLDSAGEFANNMRIFEVTGVGSLLLTDAKTNLSDFFEEDKEVVTYRNVEELIEKATYYLTHDAERERIAKRGQARTLANHTWNHRMRSLLEIIDKHRRV